MRIGNAVPVIASNTEHDGTARRSARAVNARNFFCLDAKQVPKGRICFLDNTHLGFLNDGEPRQISKRLWSFGRDSCLWQAPGIEWTSFPGETTLIRRLPEYDLTP